MRSKTKIPRIPITLVTIRNKSQQTLVFVLHEMKRMNFSFEIELCLLLSLLSRKKIYHEHFFVKWNVWSLRHHFWMIPPSTPALSYLSIRSLTSENLGGIGIDPNSASYYMKPYQARSQVTSSKLAWKNGLQGRQNISFLGKPIKINIYNLNT